MRYEKAYTLALMGLCTAILFLGQVFFAILPNIEVVSLLIIIYSLFFGKKVFWILYAFVFLEGFLYGFGIWWFNYLYVWSILACVVLWQKENTSALFWAIISGFFGLSFGGLCALPYIVLSGWRAAFAYWISGLTFDLLHCAGNFVLCFFLFRPLYRLFDFILKKQH